MKHASLGTLLVAFMACAPARSAPVPFTPDLMLAIRFTVSPNLSGTPDILSLSLGINNVTQKMDAFSSSLYDGNVLLGTHHSPWTIVGTGLSSMNPIGSWTSPTSVWNFNEPADVSFASIAAGAIDGRITMRIIGGSMNLDLANVRLWLARGTGPSNAAGVGPDPIITSRAIVPVPEPATYAIGSAIAVVMVAGFRRRPAQFKADKFTRRAKLVN